MEGWPALDGLPPPGPPDDLPPPGFPDDFPPDDFPPYDEPDRVIASYSCRMKSQIREGFAMDSKKAGILGKGEVIDAVEERVNEEGTTRVRFSKGWVSMRTAKGEVVLEPVGGTAAPDELPPGDFPLPLEDLPPGPPEDGFAVEQLEFFQQQTGADVVTAEKWVNRYPEPEPGMLPERAVQMYLSSQQSAQPTTIPPPNDEPPPGLWHGEQELKERQLAVDKLHHDVATKRSQREQARGTPHEAQLAAELQDLEEALADAQSLLLSALDEQEDHFQASGGGGMATKLSEQAATRQMFEAFSEGKGYMDRSDVVASIHHLGFECDDDYCTQLLQAFADGAAVMESDAFARMWAHLAPSAVSTPSSPPPNGPGQQSKQPEPEPEPNLAEHYGVDEDWKQRRLAELKAEEEQRLREEARKHARTAQHEEDDLAHMLRDEDILRALFSRIDPGSTGRTSRSQWLKFLETDAGVLSVMKLDGMEASQLEPLFVRWPASGITFPAFVALLRTQFGRVLGIEYVYHDEVKKVQELELKLHKEMLARQGQQREEEQKAKELERERLRQEVINEMRQQQLAQLAEIKNEVLEKLSKEKDRESQSLLEAQIAEVETAMMGLESLSEWPERLRKLEQAREDRAKQLKNQAIAMKGKAVSSEEAALAAAGWFTAQDQTGRLYYYNSMTRVTSWEMPKVAPLPPPPPPPGTGPDEDAAVGSDSASAAAASATATSSVPGAAEETTSLGAGGFTQGAAQSSPRELLDEIQQVGALRSAAAAQGDDDGIPATEQQTIEQTIGQLVVRQSQSQDASSTSGQRESIADRSRRLRETRQAEAAATPAAVEAASVQAEASPAGGMNDSPASRWTGAGSAVSTLSSTSRLLGGGVRRSAGGGEVPSAQAKASPAGGMNDPPASHTTGAGSAVSTLVLTGRLLGGVRRNSGGSLGSGLDAGDSGSTLGSSLGARNSGGSSSLGGVGSTMGLLAARRARREAENGGGSSVVRAGTQTSLAPQSGSALSAQPVNTGGALATGSADPRPRLQQTPRDSASSVLSSTRVSRADAAEPPPWATTRRVVTLGSVQRAVNASASAGGGTVLGSTALSSAGVASDEIAEAPPPWVSKRSTIASPAASRTRLSAVSSFSTGAQMRRSTAISGSGSEPWKRT